MALVAGAILFLFALFLLKNGSPWKQGNVFSRSGLEYQNMAIEDVVKKDTDGDGLLDWEEALWDLDPTKPETTPGIPDISVVHKLQSDNGATVTAEEENGPYSEEQMTETDRFSQELFSTVTALEQSGSLDEETAQKIVDSLTSRLQNPTQRKVYTLADIKIAGDDYASVKKYSDSLHTINKTYPIKGSPTEILQKFVTEYEEFGNSDALSELDPIIKQANMQFDAIKKVSVPRSLASLHLDALNAEERIIENLTDIQLYEKDIMVALVAIGQYGQNLVNFATIVTNINNTVQKKLNG